MEEQYDDEYGKLISISNFRNVDLLIKKLHSKGYDAEIYEPEDGISSPEEHKAIWLGNKISLNIAKDVILTAKEVFQHLEYIDLSNTDQIDLPDYIHSQIYIGGTTETATDRRLKPLQPNDWESLKNAISIEEFHNLIKTTNSRNIL